MDRNIPRPTMNYAELYSKPDSDNIKFKKIIKEHLLQNSDILYLLNGDGKLERDDYFGKHIFGALVIDTTNTEPKNYLCFETSCNNIDRGNDVLKIMEISFYIYVHNKNHIEISSGIERHDLIGHFLMQEFCWSSMFGMQCAVVADIGGVIDNHYIMRRITFECRTPRNIVSEGELINNKLW